MDFEIKRTITIEFKDDCFKVDLNNLEEFISKRLESKNYGVSVVKYFWGFELFKFDGGFAQFFRNNIESWKHSKKWFVTNSNFDWNIVRGLTEVQTLELIKEEIKFSILRIENMKKKPRDFNFKLLAYDMDNILKKYIQDKSVS